MTINSFFDKRLTKAGGLAFDMWMYVLRLEMRAHDWPVGKDIKDEDWVDWYTDDYTPHGAIEEDFNNA